jgi:SHS2 domain-containing protein
MKYKFIEDLTSDVMFEAYGKDLKELFRNAAEALFSVIAQTGKLKEDVSKEISVEGDDVRELMVNWLQELIARVDVEGLFFRRFEVKEISEKKLRAVCYGQEARPELGETLVKAVTYYKLRVEKTSSGWMAGVSLDI